jgi:hypothetical protein
MSIKDDMEDVQEAVINQLITENGITNTLADGQVTETKILNGAVTAAKLGSDVALGQVNDGAVTPAKLSQAYLPLTGGGVTGNVGIGTSSPSGSDWNASSTLLHLYQNSTNGSLLKLQSSNTTGVLAAGNNQLQLGTVYAHPFNFYTNGSTRMRIDASGNVVVGKTSTSFGTAGIGLLANDELTATKAGQPASFNRLYSDGNLIGLYKDSSLVGSIGSVSGTDLYIAGNRGTNSCGIKFTDAELFPVTKAGATQDNVVDIGHPSARFDDINATNGTIQTSDRNEKQDIEELSEAEQRVAVACKGLLRKFRWKSSVEENGEEARIHFGIIAQDLQAAFEAEGLDAGRYAMFISSTWTDEETEEEKTRLGVRYSELLAFIISAI